VAGKLPANIEQILNQYFGDLPNNKNGQIEYQIHPDAKKIHRVSNDEKSAQGSIKIARPFFNRHHPDFLKAQVLNIVFGGFFGSRLMTNIREDKGYTYGIHSYLMANRHENGWMITTEAGRDVSEATIQEVHKEMKELQVDLIPEEELSLVKNYMMGSILGDLDGPFQILGRWKNIILNNLEDDYFDRSIQNIKHITAEELREISCKYLNPEDFYELIVF
jgi:predicted Zn-dependent peptidase